MHYITDLWLAIVVATVACFILSALIWMIAPHHKGEWSEPPNVGGLRDLLRAGGIQAGAYTFPHMSAADRKDKARAAEKMKQWAEGPSGVLFVVPPGAMSMGKMLGQQFVFFLLVNATIALVAGRVVPFPTTTGHIYKVVFVLAFIAYFYASVPESIWFGRPWKSVALQGIDALLYSGATAATFRYLWHVAS